MSIIYTVFLDYFTVEKEKSSTATSRKHNALIHGVVAEMSHSQARRLCCSGFGQALQGV